MKVLNPVNIFEHLVGTNDDLTHPAHHGGRRRRATAASSATRTASPASCSLLAGVNVFVGLINLFPMLPFDGGHAAIATYERIRTPQGPAAYRADVGKMVPVAMAVMALLVFMFFTGLYLDIVDPIGG